MAKMCKFFRGRDETNTGPLPKILSDIQDGFALLIDRADGLVDGPAKIPLSLLNTALKLANTISDNKKDFQDLAESIQGHLAIVNKELDQTSESPESKERLRRFSQKLEKKLVPIVALSNRGIFRRLLKADADAKTITEAFRKIDNDLRDFQVEAALQKLSEASSNEASYDWGNNYDRPSCHPKTREEYLSKLEAWSQEKSCDHPRIFWMYGPAGTGKSAIVQSFCEQLQGRSRLGASFFFKRGHLSRGDVMKVFPTLAYHLARALPELELAITTSVRKDPAIFSQSLAIQLQKLIIGPCQAVALKPPDNDQGKSLSLVIAIDGLDECEGEKPQESLLRALGNAYNDWKSHLTILIASRPEAHLQSVFKEPCLALARRLEIRGSEDDVRTYLVDQFQHIQTTHKSLPMAPMVWPGDEIVEWLVQQSSGHFIYASTIVKFIDDHNWNPKRRLNLILGTTENPISSLNTEPPPGPFVALDQLYQKILADVPNQECLLTILSVIAAKLLLSALQMGELLKLDLVDIQPTLRGLHSLINVPAVVGDEVDTNRSITVHHASFLDFLNDPARSGQFHFNGTARQSLALHILKVYSEPSEIGLQPANGHVWQQLKLHFITTANLLPDMIEPLHRINFDLAIGESNFSQVAQWIKQQEQNGPGDLTQQWEDYASMDRFQDIVEATIRDPKLEEETDDMPEVMETISPTVVQIIQICTLLTYGGGWSLTMARWVLEYSWGEMWSIIAPISSCKRIDIQNLCSETSSPLRIQELNPGQVLQKLAARCIELLCMQLQRQKKGWKAAIFWCSWSYIVRACFPTLELLETVQKLVTAENLEIMQSYQNDRPWRTNHIHNLVVWLEAHPDAPLHLVERVKAFDDTENEQKYGDGWNEWKKRTGLGGI
ncbi:hypothetical protein R3P38DRAFT_3449524 [Favolaschia claudopus]|uniref:Nephrocystin 3-like N-terminal domain-containing protein n=1 Tax=Favolaschia claudopus TaxID=2862362 RepID=A0AAW0CT00_9AGAR